MIGNELFIRVPHSLGATEAKKRIAEGVAAAKSQTGQFLHSAETAWNANHLSFRIATLGQRVQGSIDVEAEFIEVRARLPLLIRMLAKHYIPLVHGAAQMLLS